MRRRAVWLWCLALLVGCEASINVESHPIVAAPQATVRNGIVELRKDNLLAHVTVARGGKVPITFTLLENLDDKTSYVSRTEHDCKARTSTLKFLVAYDADSNAVQESTMNTKIVMEPGSISEAQLNLACPKEGPNV